MDHHCTYVDADANQECALPDAILTTVGFTQEAPGGDPSAKVGVYWFAYLCPKHHQTARESGQVLA